MDNLFRRISAVMGLVGLLTSSLVAPVSAGGTPQLTASPAAQHVNSGDTFKVTLHINPEGTAVNTVNVMAAYSVDKLSFMGLDKGGAYFGAFIPAEPTPDNGHLSFAASSLGQGSTTDSVIVVSLLFKATTDSGSATIDFTGTQAANGSGAIDVDAANATVSFDASSGSNSSGISISDVKVSGITTTGATISWHTNVATTGTVDYGSSTNYGLTVDSNAPSMDHSVNLGKLFAGKTTVHFHITAVDSNAATLTSRDQTFVTLGYPVIITVVNANQQPVKGAKVRLAGHTALRTGSDGTVFLGNIGSGTQEVTAGSGKAQVIVVKAVIGAAAEKPQQFTLKETSSTAMIALTIVLLLVLIGVSIAVVLNMHRKQVTSKKKA
jgi:hypothetical protein